MLCGALSLIKKSARSFLMAITGQNMFSFVPNSSGISEAPVSLVATSFASRCAASHLFQGMLDELLQTLPRTGGCRSQFQVLFHPVLGLWELARPSVRVIPHPPWPEPCDPLAIREHDGVHNSFLPCKGEGARGADGQTLLSSRYVSASEKEVWGSAVCLQESSRKSGILNGGMEF